jgi:hypothetical protein
MHVEPACAEDSAKIDEANTVALEYLDHEVELRLKFIDVASKNKSGCLRCGGFRK